MSIVYLVFAGRNNSRRSITTPDLRFYDIFYPIISVYTNGHLVQQLALLLLLLQHRDIESKRLPIFGDGLQIILIRSKSHISLIII